MIYNIVEEAGCKGGNIYSNARIYRVHKIVVGVQVFTHLDGDPVFGLVAQPCSVWGVRRCSRESSAYLVLVC